MSSPLRKSFTPRDIPKKKLRYSSFRQPDTECFEEFQKSVNSNTCTIASIQDVILLLREKKKELKDKWQTLGYRNWKSCKSSINFEICLAYRYQEKLVRRSRKL